MDDALKKGASFKYLNVGTLLLFATLLKCDLVVLNSGTFSFGTDQISVDYENV